ncbi:hypothetical protein B0H11DRAFT_1900604 [Mycena galericulata]|nr:hypothetical protein B0H11DRAFT_1900604 [Mycena galericulata]
MHSHCDCRIDLTDETAFRADQDSDGNAKRNFGPVQSRPPATSHKDTTKTRIDYQFMAFGKVGRRKLSKPNTRIDYQDNTTHRGDGTLIRSTIIHSRKSTVDFTKEISAAASALRNQQSSDVYREHQEIAGQRLGKYRTSNTRNHRTSQQNFDLGRLDREYQENRCAAFTNIGHRELRKIGHRNFDIGGPDREYQENCWPAFRNIGHRNTRIRTHRTPRNTANRTTESAQEGNISEQIGAGPQLFYDDGGREVVPPGLHPKSTTESTIGRRRRGLITFAHRHKPRWTTLTLKLLTKLTGTVKLAAAEGTYGPRCMTSRANYGALACNESYSASAFAEGRWRRKPTPRVAHHHVPIMKEFRHDRNYSA